MQSCINFMCVKAERPKMMLVKSLDILCSYLTRMTPSPRTKSISNVLFTVY